MMRTPTFRTVLTALLAAAACLAAAWHGGPARGQDTVPVPPEGVAVTIYNDDLALVKDVRTIQLAAGETVHRFEGVTRRIDPTSVRLEALQNPGRVSVLEQNYEFDLVSTARLLEKFTGDRIRVHTRDGVHEGRLLNADGANILLEEDGGRVRAVRTPDNLTGVRFPDLPGGLLVRPTLVWTLASPDAGAERARVSYLTGGLSWRADYNAVLDADETGMELGAWVTIDNRSGVAFEDATVKTVAGDVHRVRPELMEMRRTLGELKFGAPSGVTEETFGDYHLYTLPRPVTLADNQTKQVELLDVERARAAKTYRVNVGADRWRGGFHVNPNGRSEDPDVQVWLEFRNEEDAGLGMPLPGGVFRVYQRDSSGSLQFVGEDRLDHTPRNEDVRIRMGNAFDVTAEFKQTDFQVDGDEIVESFQLTLRNHKDADVTVEVRDGLWRAENWELTDTSAEAETLDAFTLGWNPSVAADGETVLTWTVRYWR